MGITDCFCVVGGGAMHLNNALALNTHMTSHFNHHEQACAMATEAYARYWEYGGGLCYKWTWCDECDYWSYGSLGRQFTNDSYFWKREI